MKIRLLALPILLAATPTFAQQGEPGEKSAEAAVKLTIDSSIEALMANEVARAVVEAHLPGLDAHPAYLQFKGMSLPAVQPFSQGVVTDEVLAKIKAGLAALG